MSEEIQQYQRTPEEVEAEIAKVKVETKKLEAETRQAEASAIKTELEARAAWRKREREKASDEENRLSACGETRDKFLSVAEEFRSLGEVDDVDSVSLAEDVRPHLWVPAFRLVTKVGSGLQQLFHCNGRQASPIRDQDTYRLLNWNLFRAPARPYFLRSLIRASRVSRPAFFRCGRSSGSN